MTNFVHLHCHSSFSLLESPLSIKSICKSAKEMGMPAIALTDNGSMFGAVDFVATAKKEGLNPIVGCELYLTKTINEKQRSYERLILLAKNQQGYQNLVKLVTVSHLDGFYYKPRIDIAHLEKYNSDLIAISPGLSGPIANAIKSTQDEQAIEFSKQFKQIYGDNFYLGINRLGVPFEDLIITKSQQISASLDIPLVVTNDVYYLKRESQFLCDILSCIQTGRRISEVNTSKFDSKEMYLKSPEEMTELFKDIPEAISNTVKIANQCKISLETETVKLPNFKCPDGLDDVSYLKKLVDEGLQKKYGTITDEIKERVKFELDIINKMHYAPYFLIIFDFLKFSRDNNIPVGPGRGSAAGSIVAYVLDITRIDPIEYKLLFERFLNPERVSMPDVDIDFCIKRRNEVIDYIVNAYGTDHVSQIVTFGTMAARGVVRDVSRVLDIPLNEVDTIAKLIPSGPGNSMSIPEAIESISELNEKVNANPKIKEMMDIAIKLEGLYRHCSTHAAGVVISKDPLSDVVPLIKNDGQIVTQFSMVDLESVGLLKMDILGLRNLTVIQDCLELIKQNHNKTLDLDSIGYDDKATYDLLCTGKTVGIFQLESQGMRNLIKDLQPQTFNDLIALLALYRPGPLGSGMVNDFISNKSGKTEVQYDLPELEPILKETYGMIVYQEQVMQIASVIGGFSLGQADMLRRAMGKKEKVCYG